MVSAAVAPASAPTFQIPPGSTGVLARRHLVQAVQDGIIAAHDEIPETNLQPASGSSLENELHAYYRLSHPVAVFRDAHITDRGSRGSPYGLWLNPGQVDEISHEFFVPRSRFPFLEARVVDVYSKDTKHVIPTVLSIDRSGLAYPHTVAPDAAVQSNVLAAELDLAAQ